MFGAPLNFLDIFHWENSASQWLPLEADIDPASHQVTATITATGVYALLSKTSEGYSYLPGDANMYNGAWPPAVIGSDVTYLVNYFRGMPSNPACILDGFYCSADVNADCRVIGSDVTRLMNFFRGLGIIEPCPDYPPAWLTSQDCPEEAPGGWPNCEEAVTSGKVTKGQDKGK